MVQLVLAGRLPDLPHQDLHLVGLHLLGEDRRQRLGVRVGERLRVHVLASVGVPAEVGQADPRDPQVLELAVLAGAGERDAVVDLRDLVQRGAGVLREEQQAIGVLHGHHRLPASDALAGVLGAVLHELLGRDVRLERHQLAPRPCSSAIMAS